MIEVSQFNVKVRDKLTGAEGSMSVGCPGMTDDECLKHVEALPGPAGTAPRHKVLEITRTGALHQFDHLPEPKVVFKLKEDAPVETPVA